MLFLVLWHHFELRAPYLKQAFWLDETAHNFNTLSPKDFLGLRFAMQYEYQPVLEYALRRYFWFPLFGHQEFGLRLPSIFYSLLTCAMVVLLSLAVLRRSVKSLPLALLGAGLVGVWLSGLPIEISAAAEARHYSFVILMSIVWVYGFLFFSSGRRYPYFLAASVFFLNTHFFSFPLVGAGLAFELVRKLAVKDYRSVRRLAVFVVAAFTFTITLNLPAFSRLFYSPPYGGPLELTLPRQLENVGGLLGRLAEVFHVSVLFSALSLLLLGFAMRNLCRPRPHLGMELVRFGYLGGLVVPLFLFFIRTSSSYYFSDRYFAPFLGLAAALVLFIVESGLVLVEGELVKLRPRLSQGVAGLALATLCVFLANRGIAMLPSIPRRAANFTDTAALFHYLKSQQAPTLVIGSPCYSMVIVDFYMRYIGNPPPKSPSRSRALLEHGTDTACVTGNLLRGRPAAERIEAMVKEGPVNILLTELTPTCDRAPQSPLGPKVKVRRVFSFRSRESESACLFLIEGARSVAQVREIAAVNHLRIAENLEDASMNAIDPRSVAAVR